MKLRYQTGTGTLIQLIVMMLLNFATAIQSMIVGCINGDGCVSGIVINILFVIVLAIWLIFLSALGYQAQTKRSKRLAKLIIAGEALVAIVTFFNIRHYPDILGLITSIIDCALALWVIYLAWNLNKANVSTPNVAAPRGSRPRRRVQS